MAGRVSQGRWRSSRVPPAARASSGRSPGPGGRLDHRRGHRADDRRYGGLLPAARRRTSSTRRSASSRRPAAGRSRHVPTYANFEELSRAVDEGSRQFGRLDIVSATAGILVWDQPAHELLRDQWDRVMDTNAKE
ncbi:SDR family NAD(P)-dependent oxidoreductase [Streptomyces sp. L7]